MAETGIFLLKGKNMPDAIFPAGTGFDFLSLVDLRPAEMTSQQRAAYAAQLLADPAGALLRAGFDIALGVVTPNEVRHARLYGWDTYRRY